jgi:hypothetical protein
LRLQVLCFRLNADSFFHTKTQTIISLLPSLCGTALVAIPVLARPATFANRSPLSVASTFAAAPYAQFIFPRESHRAEDGAASVADFTREDSVLREEFVTLLGGEQHG